MDVFITCEMRKGLKNFLYMYYITMPKIRQKTSIKKNNIPYKSNLSIDQPNNIPPPKNIDNKSSQSNQPNQPNNMIKDISSSILSGFSFGLGSSVARNVVDNLYEKKPIKTENVNSNHLCNEYLECIKNNNEEYCKDLKLCYKYSSLFTKELDK